MGLISDALKRAEQERLQKTQGESAAQRTGGHVEPVPPDELVDVPAGLMAEAMSAEFPPESTISTADGNVQLITDTKEFKIHEAVVAYHDKAAEITEQYRSLRARLTAQNSTGENQVVAITSSIPREGKSVTTLNMSWVMSEIKHFRVLMVDGDFRRSSLANMMGVSEYPGLADLLRGEAKFEEVVRATPIPNLHLITAGTTQEYNAAELLSTQKTGSILQECKRRYQYTFVDTPPASTVSDASVLSPWCTGVLFVVRMGKTPEPVAKSTIRLLQANNVHIIGCVLAGHRETTSRYRRYYGYYSKYYSEPY